jgi:hypothetical protein
MPVITDCSASKLVLGVVLETSARSWHMKYIEAINLAARSGFAGSSGWEPNAKHDKVCPGEGMGGVGSLAGVGNVKATAPPSTLTCCYVYVILLCRHLF